MNLFTAKMYNLSLQFFPGIADKTVLIKCTSRDSPVRDTPLKKGLNLENPIEYIFLLCNGKFRESEWSVALPDLAHYTSSFYVCILCSFYRMR